MHGDDILHEVLHLGYEKKIAATMNKLPATMPIHRQHVARR